MSGRSVITHRRANSIADQIGESSAGGGPPPHRGRRFADLIRFVVGPIGEAVPDVKNKLPGRGIWVTATRPALEDAIKRKVFSRGFKRDVRLPADLVLQTEMSLVRAALDALAIAGKAGTVLAGVT